MAKHEMATRRVLYEIPGMESVVVDERPWTGADGQPLAMAIYRPLQPIADPPPVVVLVEGYTDPGFAKFMGCRFMDMAWAIGTAQLIAASGLAAIVYANRQPAADAAAMLDYIASHAGALGVDGTRVGILATSGNGPVALSVLSRARCAVLSNALLFDFDGATHVADAAKMFGFTAPVITAIPEAVPMFVIRSGHDEIPGLNAALDRFVMRALAENRPITLVNHPDAPHGFDLNHDSATTRQILRQALAFLREQLHTFTR